MSYDEYAATIDGPPPEAEVKKLVYVPVPQLRMGMQIGSKNRSSATVVTDAELFGVTGEGTFAVKVGLILHEERRFEERVFLHGESAQVSVRSYSDE